ncbi:MAG: hypothetical protein OEZ68_09240 [Gammaproteobacteria bacterium]|nr:hypothetical protein [Gammaproteobacteria bacterium]MDH5800972.1 hypothetical protein [Gammaproteobacteria bacterium]
MTQSSRYQVYAYYLLSIVILSVFAFRNHTQFEVPPDSGLILCFAAPFFFAALLYIKLEKWCITNTDALDQPRRQLIVDLSLYTVIATSIAGIEYFYYQVPQLVALKFFVWAAILGYFASIDNALNRERLCVKSKRFGYELNAASSAVAHRLNLFLSVTVLVVIIAIAMTAYSYINLEGSLLDLTMNDLKQAFIVDTLFIIGFIVSLTVRLIYSFSINLQHFFDTQLAVLRNVEEGNLESLVPVLSRDEFGVIAHQTNSMIYQLREKQKAQQTLEKIVSPDIMHKLLTGDEKDLKQGQEYEIAILFCDLRKFTSYAENTPPEEVIFFLNAYFTKISDIVTEHGGIINKFMGDAILAVFGIDNNEEYIQAAIDTAWDILMHSDSIKMRDGSTFHIGIGVHKGLAAAGTIGSADRYEYTFIGDAVNTASRLDGLSKRLGYQLITSKEVYQELNRDSQDRFVDLGSQHIRGKSTAVHVYGAVNRDNEEEEYDDDDDDNIVPFSTGPKYAG